MRTGRKENVHISTDRLLIRSLEASDRDDYLYAASLVSDYPDQYRDGELADILWRDVLGDSDNLTMLIYEKESDRPVGTCSFDYCNSGRPEIGINVDPALHNQGIGTETVRRLKEEAAILFPDSQLLIRTRKDNVSCLRMIKKCGGRLLEDGDIITFAL